MMLKHKNNTDVAIEILKLFYIKEKREYKLRVMWYRISQARPPIKLEIKQRLTIPKAAMPDWRPYYYTPGIIPEVNKLKIWP